MAERLAGWGLGVLHAALLLLAFVALAYRAGSLGALLAGIGTLGGLALGLWLGGLSVAASIWTLRGADLQAPDTRRIAKRAVIAGGVTGALFVDGLFLLSLTLAQEIAWQSLVFVVVGGAFGFVGGTLVGTLFMGLDVGLLKLAEKMPRDDADA